MFLERQKGMCAATPLHGIPVSLDARVASVADNPGAQLLPAARQRHHVIVSAEAAVQGVFMWKGRQAMQLAPQKERPRSQAASCAVAAGWAGRAIGGTEQCAPSPPGNQALPIECEHPADCDAAMRQNGTRFCAHAWSRRGDSV